MAFKRGIYKHLYDQNDIYILNFLCFTLAFGAVVVGGAIFAVLGTLLTQIQETINQIIFTRAVTDRGNSFVPLVYIARRIEAGLT